MTRRDIYGLIDTDAVVHSKLRNLSVVLVDVLHQRLVVLGGAHVLGVVGVLVHSGRGDLIVIVDGVVVVHNLADGVFLDLHALADVLSSRELPQVLPLLLGNAEQFCLHLHHLGAPVWGRWGRRRRREAAPW